MTIEEIKDTLQTWIKNADDEFDREEMGRVYGLKSALHLIEKLDVPGANAGDLISRDAVLDLVANYDLSMGQVVRGIHDLPSTTPTPKQSLDEPCDDLISRQALQEWIKDKTFGDIVVASEHNFDCLPSVEPERKTGKWEYIQYDGNPKIGNWHCSECRLIVNLGFEGEPYYHYCPSCGARMEVDNG